MLLVHRIADSVHTTVATRLPFQPARPAALNLTQHSPARDFISTPSHFTLCSLKKYAAQYSPFSPLTKSDDFKRKGFRAL